MLQSIRDHTQGWIAGVIISILILSFALWGIHSYIEGSSVNTSVAEVNGVEITQSQLSVTYERLRRQLQAQLGSTEIPNIADAGLKNKALQTLIDTQVLKQGSIKQNFRISSTQVDTFLENMPEFQLNGSFSVAKFNQLLSSSLFSPAEFLETVKTSLLIDQPRLGVIFSSFALPNEVAQAISLINQERQIQYLTIPFQIFEGTLPNIPEVKINEYYQTHQNEFKTLEQMSVEYIELSVDNLIKNVKATDTELQNFYNENPENFAESSQWRLDKIVIPIAMNATDQDVNQAKIKMDEIANKAKEGTDFSTLAKQYSLGHTNESKWVKQTQIPTELQGIVLNLKKPGQISDPIRANNDIILIKVMDYIEGKSLPFDQAKEKVREAYARQKAEEQFLQLREKLATLAYEHPESLKVVSQELNLPIQVSQMFTREKGENDITSNSKVREIAFSHDVMNLQNNSDVISKDANSVIVLRIKTHTPQTQLTLDKVRDQIVAKLREIELNNHILIFASDLKKKLESNANLDAALSQYNLKWTDVGYISRYSKDVKQNILDAAFEMPKPTSNTNYVVVKEPASYVIVAVKGVKQGTQGGSRDYTVFAEQYQNAQGLLEYELYKQSLINKANIETNNNTQV